MEHSSCKIGVIYYANCKNGIIRVSKRRESGHSEFRVIGARDLMPSQWQHQYRTLVHSARTGGKLKLKYVFGIYSITEVMIDVYVFPKKLRNISLTKV